jgi:hypothetical protein
MRCPRTQQRARQIEDDRKAALAEKLKREDDRERKLVEQKNAKAAGGCSNKDAKIAAILEVMAGLMHLWLSQKSLRRSLMLCTPTVHKHAPGQRKQQLESGWIQSIVEKNEEKVQAPTCFFLAMDDDASGIQVLVLTASLVSSCPGEEK